VGGTYFLPRLGLDVGLWLGLTGARLNAAQALELGVANNFVPSDKHEWLIKALGEADLDGSDEAVVSVINKFQEAGPMDADLPAALVAFNEKDVPSILNALDGKRGLDLDFKSAMSQELDISLNFLKTQDFYEGIRAQLIDKDRNPKWSHESVETVTDEQVARVFKQTIRVRSFYHEHCRFYRPRKYGSRHGG